MAYRTRYQAVKIVNLQYKISKYAYPKNITQ